jgi:hypothetical protein
MPYGISAVPNVPREAAIDMRCIRLHEDATTWKGSPSFVAVDATSYVLPLGIITIIEHPSIKYDKDGL